MVFRGCVLFGVAIVVVQAQWFAGAGGGVSTLSADGQTRIDNAATAISLYKPENGLSAHAFAGRHLNNYFSLQGSYLHSTGCLRQWLFLLLDQKTNDQHNRHTRSGLHSLKSTRHNGC